MTDRNESRELVALTRAERALAAASSPEEVLVIRQGAELVRLHAQIAKLGLKVQNLATALRLKAERKLGEMLADLHLRGGNHRTKSTDGTVTLEELGITRSQSSRWQREAAVPDDVFAEFVETVTQKQLELTAAALLRWVKRYHGGLNGGKPPRRTRKPPTLEQAPDDDRGPATIAMKCCGKACPYGLPEMVRQLREMSKELWNHQRVLAGLLEADGWWRAVAEQSGSR